MAVGRKRIRATRRKAARGSKLSFDNFELLEVNESAVSSDGNSEAGG